MKKMNKTMILLGAISIVPFLAPGLLWAEVETRGSVTLGAGTVNLDADSAKFGEYTGLEDGSFVIGGFDLSGRRDQFYFRASGEDLGLDNRSIGLEGGKYNSFTLRLDYDELIHKISNNAMTPFEGVGSDNLTLPTGFVTAGTTGGMTTLASDIRPVRLDTVRTATGLALDMHLSDRLKGSLSIRQEDKEGRQEWGGTVGYRGWPSSAILPKPVDYTTDELRASLAYATEKAQLEAAYYLSTFRNAHDALSWEVPFECPASPPGCPAFPDDARMAQEPDNRNHRLSLSGGLNVSPELRLSAVLEKGEMTQDEDLLAYGVNGSPPALPRTSAEAEIETTLALLRVNWRATPRLKVNGQVRQYETENNTEVDSFTRVINDYPPGASPLVPAQAGADNEPYDAKVLQTKLDGAYYFGGGTSLKLGVEREKIDRSHRSVEETTEDTYSAKLNTRLDAQASLSVGYSHARREGDTYQDLGLTHPNLRQFDIADRQRRDVDLALVMTPDAATTVSIMTGKRADNYDAANFGLVADDSRSLTLDLSHTPREGVTWYAFLTREKVTRQQNGREYTTGTGNATTDWSITHDEDINTLGVGAKLSLLEDRLSIKADLMRATGSGVIGFETGSALTATDLPDLGNRRTTFDLKGEYQVSEQIGVLLGFQHERYASNDYYLDGFTAADTAVSQVLLLNGGPEDYKANVVYTALKYRW